VTKGTSTYFDAKVGTARFSSRCSTASAPLASELHKFAEEIKVFCELQDNFAACSRVLFEKGEYLALR
jgi:hypothetical protein